MERIKLLDAQQVQDLLTLMAIYFEGSEEEVMNFRADLIAKNLHDAAGIISRRAGN
jgi:hypothetical protein